MESSREMRWREGKMEVVVTQRQTESSRRSIPDGQRILEPVAGDHFHELLNPV